MTENECRLFTGEMDADLELWLGEGFNSWLPRRRQLEIYESGQIRVVSEGERIMKTPSGFELKTPDGAA
jgi:hypothetical protein